MASDIETRLFSCRGWRSQEQVDTMLRHAKLQKAELSPVAQCLSFVPELHQDNIKLLEVDPSMLDFLTAGQRLVVRGNKSDIAVLCTDSTTFQLREAETSNSLLLLQECSFPEQLDEGHNTLRFREVCAVKREYFELRKIKPRLKRLKDMLEENPYSGREYEQDDQHQGPKYTFTDLCNAVQASDAEIKKGMHVLQASLIDGYWRMLDFDLIGRVLGSIIALKDEQSWEYESIPCQQCCDILEELYPRCVVKDVLEHYSDISTDTEHMETGEEQVYPLSEDKICRYFAEMLLKPTGKFNFEEFMTTWQLSVPEGMKTALYQLEGLALVQQDCTPNVVTYFPLANLPEDVEDRFNFLFRFKQKWTLNEIQPYILDLTTEKLSVGALLTKYARASTQNAIKMYSSRKPLS